MPAIESPLITMAAPISSAASTLIASSTLCSGRTEMSRCGFAFSRSDTVFMAASSGHGSSYTFRLHVRIVRAASAFRHDPADVLHRILDVARLAVHAILRVDLQPRLIPFDDNLVDPGGAVALLGSVVEGEVHV